MKLPGTWGFSREDIIAPPTDPYALAMVGAWWPDVAATQSFFAAAEHYSGEAETCFLRQQELERAERQLHEAMQGTHFDSMFDVLRKIVIDQKKLVENAQNLAYWNHRFGELCVELQRELQLILDKHLPIFEKKCLDGDLQGANVEAGAAYEEAKRQTAIALATAEHYGTSLKQSLFTIRPWKASPGSPGSSPATNVGKAGIQQASFGNVPQDGSVSTASSGTAERQMGDGSDENTSNHHGDSDSNGHPDDDRRISGSDADQQPRRALPTNTHHGQGAEPSVHAPSLPDPHRATPTTPPINGAAGNVGLGTSSGASGVSPGGFSSVMGGLGRSPVGTEGLPSQGVRPPSLPSAGAGGSAGNGASAGAARPAASLSQFAQLDPGKYMFTAEQTAQARANAVAATPPPVVSGPALPPVMPAAAPSSGPVGSGGVPMSAAPMAAPVMGSVGAPSVQAPAPTASPGLSQGAVASAPVAAAATASAAGGGLGVVPSEMSGEVPARVDRFGEMAVEAVRLLVPAMTVIPGLLVAAAVIREPQGVPRVVFGTNDGAGFLPPGCFTPGTWIHAFSDLDSAEFDRRWFGWADPARPLLDYAVTRSQELSAPVEVLGLASSGLLSSPVKAEFPNAVPSVQAASDAKPLQEDGGRNIHRLKVLAPTFFDDVARASAEARGRAAVRATVTAMATPAAAPLCAPGAPWQIMNSGRNLSEDEWEQFIERYAEQLRLYGALRPGFMNDSQTGVFGSSYHQQFALVRGMEVLLGWRAAPDISVEDIIYSAHQCGADVNDILAPVR